MRAVLATAILAAGALGACEAAHAESMPLGPVDSRVVRFVPAPLDVHFDDPLPGVANSVVVSGTSANSLETTHLFVVDLAAARVRKLSVPTPSVCGTSSEQFPQRLANGTLAFIRYCLGHPGVAAGRSVRLVRFDERTRTVAPLVPYSLPFFVGRFASRADGRGVINDGRGLSDRLEWLAPSGLRPLQLRWARAGQPAWSPDGRLLAVAGAAAAGSPRSPPSAWTLYLLHPDGSVFRPLVAGIENPGRPAWSKDSRWIALTMTADDGVRGVYLIGVRTGTVRLIRQGDSYGNVSWGAAPRTILAAIGSHLRRTGGERVGLEEIRIRRLGP